MKNTALSEAEKRTRVLDQNTKSRPLRSVRPVAAPFLASSLSIPGPWRISGDICAARLRRAARASDSNEARHCRTHASGRLCSESDHIGQPWPSHFLFSLRGIRLVTLPGPMLYSRSLAARLPYARLATRDPRMLSHPTPYIHWNGDMYVDSGPGGMYWYVS
jgi:hypothetical protein